MLRHDWGADPFHSGWREIISGGFSGWYLGGIGRPSLYPDGYLISLPVALATAIAGNRAALFLVLLATGALAAFGGRAVARDAGGRAAAAAAASLFCVFNPWTYTELVAGHVYMLLAYAASIWLFRELLGQRPRVNVLIVAALLTLQQLQFFAVSTGALAVLVALRRRMWLPLAVVLLAWIPVAIGILSDRTALDAIPFVASWEREQSVSPIGALQLSGYFTQYAKSFGYFSLIPMFVTLILACGAFLFLNDKRRTVIAIGTAAALSIAMGFSGPLYAHAEWLVEHVRIAGLYRELFDVLAYVAIGYLILAAAACGRLKWLGWAWLAAMVLLPKPWFTSPPARYFVTAGALPNVVVPPSPNTRFALIPAFQPMSYQGRGSGRDPDLGILPDNVTPLNEAFATYPGNAALGAFSLTGSTRRLEALSVATIVERPYLQSDSMALAAQWALPFTGFRRPKQERTILLRPGPELALVPTPEIGTLVARIGDGNVFFADAAAARGPLVPGSWRRLGSVVRVAPPNAQTKAAAGWVDARLAFAQRPALAQSLGGALTTDGSAVLPVLGRLSALVFVEGSLRSTDGRELARTTGGYRWITVPSGVRAVRCLGLCVVAAQGDPPPAPLEPPPHAARPLTFRLITPWLVLAEVPGGAPGALRYNTAYDERWSAYLSRTALTHVRLDGAINGWLLPGRAGTQPLVLLETTSAAEVVSELVVVSLVFWLAARWIGDALAARLPRTALRAVREDVR